MSAYYNEIDPFAAQWLRNLIAAGHLPAGDVDERDIRDVRPDDLKRYTQCHFFAGIGGWAHALRLAGWPDDRPVWTGSCPCQPFSAAGRRAGVADERHLWPHWFHLIGQCRPATVFGEQVASKDGLGWLDLVSADMEGAGYAFAANDLCAAGVGAPHIRQRLWFVGLADADAASERMVRDSHSELEQRQEGNAWSGHWSGGCDGGLADGDDRGHWLSSPAHGSCEGHAGQAVSSDGGCHERLADAKSGGRRKEQPHGGGGVEGNDAREAGGLFRRGDLGGLANADNAGSQGWLRMPECSAERAARTSGLDSRPSPTDGFWRDADWLFCRDGKWRPVEPASQRMANGLSLCLGSMRRARIDEKEEGLNAEDCVGLGRKALRVLRQSDDPEAFWLSVGGCIGFPQATFLLAILCEYSRELGIVCDSETASGTQDGETFLRTLRQHASPTSCASQGSEYSEQLTRELGDALSKLSQDSTQYRELMKSLASYTAGPLANNLSARVGRLRGYGNAIVPQVAQAFIEAVMECRP